MITMPPHFGFMRENSRSEYSNSNGYKQAVQVVFQYRPGKTTGTVNSRVRRPLQNG
jgi:hypothetical protein